MSRSASVHLSCSSCPTAVFNSARSSTLIAITHPSGVSVPRLAAPVFDPPMVRSHIRLSDTRKRAILRFAKR
jgi:hypothetical protein